MTCPHAGILSLLVEITKKLLFSEDISLKWLCYQLNVWTHNQKLTYKAFHSLRVRDKSRLPADIFLVFSVCAWCPISKELQPLSGHSDSFELAYISLFQPTTFPQKGPFIKWKNKKNSLIISFSKYPLKNSPTFTTRIFNCMKVAVPGHCPRGSIFEYICH